jgi:hypothetical protein
MCQTAGTVCDRALPDVPLRRWVMSVPYELRRVLASDPAMLTRTSRVFFQELRRWYREAVAVAVEVEGVVAQHLRCEAMKPLVHRGVEEGSNPGHGRAPRLRTPAEHVDLPGASAAHVGWSSDHAARRSPRGCPDGVLRGPWVNVGPCGLPDAE